MKDQNPRHLKIHDGEAASDSPRVLADPVAATLRAFSQATGWGIRSSLPRSLQVASDQSFEMWLGKNSEAVKPQRWELAEAVGERLVAKNAASVKQTDAALLLTAIESLAAELRDCEEEIRRLKAAGATEISVVRQADPASHLAERLEAILLSSTQAIGADAAGVYLLDESTTHLTLRSAINLSSAAFRRPPRQLAGSLTDLEAMLGNAVLLEDLRLLADIWTSPEDFASAIVVPLGSPAMPQGTLWFWTDRVRKYDPAQVETANLAAGRVMAELEQSVLSQELQANRRSHLALDDAAEMAAERLPTKLPIHRDVEIAGWSSQASMIGGAVHDWDVDASGHIVAMLSAARGGGPSGGIVASAIHAATRSGWVAGQTETQNLQIVSDYLFEGGDAWLADHTLVRLCGNTGHGSILNAGENQWIVLSPRGVRPIAIASSPLGNSPEDQARRCRFVLQPGEVLLGLSRSLVAQLNIPSALHIRGDLATAPAAAKLRQKRRVMARSLDQQPIIQRVMAMIDEPAQMIADALRDQLPIFLSCESGGSDRCAVVIKNCRKP